MEGPPLSTYMYPFKCVTWPALRHLVRSPRDSLSEGVEQSVLASAVSLRSARLLSVRDSFGKFFRPTPVSQHNELYRQLRESPLTAALYPLTCHFHFSDWVATKTHGENWARVVGGAALAPQNVVAEQTIGSSGITLVSAQAPD